MTALVESAGLSLVSDRDDKDRPVIRAEFTLNKQVQEILTVGIPGTRRARVMTVVELIRARVVEAYGYEGDAA